MWWANALNILYMGLVVFIAIYGLHALIVTLLYLLHFREKSPAAIPPAEWPVVAVQLPFFNEQTVAERMIDMVAAFDYPKDKLIIQVLDDSTDQTTEIVMQRIQHFRSLGYEVRMLHRTDRTGFKAKALAGGLAETDADFIAVFDADFMPPPDFLKRVIPQFGSDPHIGMVQTRWGHFNRDANLLTRTQALFLDGHQVVEQVARSRSDLLLNFNGSGGIWRTDCLRDSGGWDWDTLAEDIDVSYRAQLKGWKLKFLPDFIIPAEIPLTMLAFKKQQNRWTFGHIQVFRKLIWRIWRSPGLNLAQRIGGTFHLSTNFIQLAALISFLLTIPMALLHPKEPPSLGLISLASTGPTILFAVSQIFGYHDGFKRTLERLAHLPVLCLVAVGLTLSNSVSVLGAVTGGKMVWSVTPKNPKKSHGLTSNAFSVSPMVWGEIAISVYCTIALSLALVHAHDFIAISSLGMLSFGYVGFSGLVESGQPPKKASTSVEMAQQ